MSALTIPSAYALALLTAVAAAAIPARAQSLSSLVRADVRSETLTPDVRPERLATDDRIPRPFDDVSPVYPEAMSRRQLEGDVVAEYVIAADGRPSMRSFVVVQSTDHLFADAVWTAVEQSRYIPAEARGEPVPMAIRRVFRFRIDRDAVRITEPRTAR